MNFGRPEWIVLSLIDKVRKLNPIREDRLDTSISFSNTINNTVTTIKNVECEHYLFNPEILSLLCEKLLPIQKYNWGKYKHCLEATGTLVSLEHFADWFEEEVNAMAAVSQPFARSSGFRQYVRKENIMVSKGKNSSVSEKVCVFCKSDRHTIVECGSFSKKPVAERRAFVSEQKLCFICLRPGHFSLKCYHQKKRCGENECNGKHHKLLHMERNLQAEAETQEFCGKQSSEDNTVLLRIVPVRVKGPTEEMKVFALFDEGSTCTMIDAELADRLHLRGPTVPLCFQWTNGISHYEDKSRMVSFDIAADKKHPTFYQLRNVRTVYNLDLPRQKISIDYIMKKHPYLDRQILEEVKEAKPMILIGQDHCGLIIPRQVIQPRNHQIIMSNSKLGWSIHGATGYYQNETEHVNLCCNHVNRDDELHLMVKNSFQLEAFGIKLENNIVKSVEDRRALEIMEKTLKKGEDNHYEIGHLWKNEEETLPDSRQVALRRLYCMERKMDKDAAFAEQYCKKINEYLHKNYARKLDPIEVVSTPKTWYLPHFAVWNIHKPGKIRMVFDAAARSHGFSLNDFLLQGPNLVPSLLAVLWRFRQYRIAVNGDIAEMFHQVNIRQEDRCAQRFFWRENDKSREPDVYEMKAMIFGAVSSPSVAQFVKNKNAECFADKIPGIERIIKKQHYVDDFLDSFESEDRAIESVKNVIHVHRQAGFQMTKWISNSEKVILSLPEELRAVDPETLRIDTEKMERVLGLSWSPASDCFVFVLNLKKIGEHMWNGERVPTKREVLRVVMSIFDPIGFLGPITIKARILLQNIWRINIDWDAEITEDLFELWQTWLNDLKYLAPISIPRCYFPTRSKIQDVDLHLFCDASDKAYAAVAYLRIAEGKIIDTAFVTAKFKVAPLKQQTIPKLELQAAVLACRISKTIKEELEYNIKDVHYWTDSTVVLSQIKSESKRFPVFVACRIGEIQECTEARQWHWVPSEHNVADLATKERKPVNLHNDSPWMTGPDFLKKNLEFWPKPFENHNEMENLEKCENVLLANHKKDALDVLPDISRFSKWLRLVRTTAWVIRWVSLAKLRKPSRPSSLNLDAETTNKAHKLWIKKCQEDCFSNELKLLREKKPLPKSSRIFKLSAFIDEEDIIRLGGRIPQDVEINYELRCPIILDSKHQYTQLLIKHTHEAVGHIGLETVVNNLRTKYWILGVRSAVKNCFYRCQECKIRKCKPITPEMGELPKGRLENFIPPFTYTGIDLFGPMTVSVGRHSEKRYGVLFTCLTIRAIHIELATSLDTSSTICAIRKFICRRGQPKEFRTDNGTNFVGAERELSEWWSTLDQTQVSEFLGSRGIEWKFNPPSAPHMGGIWERMIRSVKTALKIALKTVNPKEEILTTLLTEVEHMVNSRPLTHISMDPNEPEAITPNHFLLLRPSGVTTAAENDISSRKQWRIAQALADSFWKRWVREYRPTLIPRPKWQSKNESLKTEDIVIIVDDKMPRNEWLMGKVIRVFPGKDQIVRVVEVKTKKGNFIRSVTKLCPIPVSSEGVKSVNLFTGGENVNVNRSYFSAIYINL